MKDDTARTAPTVNTALTGGLNASLSACPPHQLAVRNDEELNKLLQHVISKRVTSQKAEFAPASSLSLCTLSSDCSWLPSFLSIAAAEGGVIPNIHSCLLQRSSKAYKELQAQKQKLAEEAMARLKGKPGAKSAKAPAKTASKED